eukprot:5002368-Lingulodinium_polyedra.AAC.1
MTRRRGASVCKPAFTAARTNCGYVLSTRTKGRGSCVGRRHGGRSTARGSATWRATSGSKSARTCSSGTWAARSGKPDE